MLCKLHSGYFALEHLQPFCQQKLPIMQTRRYSVGSPFCHSPLGITSDMYVQTLSMATWETTGRKWCVHVPLH